jgi:hypothetical protein
VCVRVCAGPGVRGVSTKPRVLSECSRCHAVVFASFEPPALMVHVEGCPLAGRQACEWCGGPMRERPEAKAVCCSDRCRAARWKWNRGYGPKPAAKRRTNGTRRSGQSGLTVSYRKAVRALCHDLEAPLLYAGYSLKDAREAIEAALRSALSEKQRARLEAREQ